MFSGKNPAIDPATESPQRLRRQLGPVGLLFISTGSVIGSAWLFAAMYAAQIAGPGAILSWIVAAIATLLLALVYAELGAAFPVAGGLARFSYFSHGTLAGFVAASACWLGYVCIAPIEVQAIIRYLADALPWLVQPGTRLLSGAGMGVAVILLLALSAVNLGGVRWLNDSNRVITCWKLVVPVLIPVTLLAKSFHAENFTAFGGFLPAGMGGVFSAVSAGGAVFALLGFRTAIELAGEAKNPRRDVPLALIGSVLITSAIYILIQVAFIGALPASALAHGWKGLASHVETGPFVQLLTAAGLLVLAKLLLVDAVVSPGGCALIFCGATARLCYAMARNGQIPAAVGRLSRAGVPAFALGINFLAGLVFLLPSQTWQSLVNFISSIMVLSLAFGPPALLALRRSAPEVERPFRLPAARLLCAFAFGIANCMIYWCGWRTNAVGLCALVVLAALFAAIFWLGGASRRLDVAGMIWVAPYLAGLALISWLGHYGGGLGWLPAGTDYAGLAALSLVVLALAARAGVNRAETSVRLGLEPGEAAPATATESVA
jgi:amino acid transporter